MAYLIVNARRTTAKFGMQTRTDHVQDTCWVYVYRGRRYKNNNIFSKMRADIPCGESAQATGRSVGPYAVGQWRSQKFFTGGA